MRGAALRRAHGVPVPAEDAVCVICGCSDSSACPEGCAWLVVDRAKRRGICSSCGDRALARLVRRRRRKR